MHFSSTLIQHSGALVQAFELLKTNAADEQGLRRKSRKIMQKMLNGSASNDTIIIDLAYPIVFVCFSLLLNLFDI